MAQLVRYSKTKGLPARILAGLLLTVVIVGGLALAAAHSGEKLTGHEIPAGECKTVTSENGITTVEELVRQAVGQFAPNSSPLDGGPVNMAAALTEAQSQFRGNLPRKGTPVTACPKLGDPHMVASVGVDQSPINLGGR